MNGGYHIYMTLVVLQSFEFLQLIFSYFGVNLPTDENRKSLR